MPELADKIAAARDELSRLERQALHATCADLGCNMVRIGGCNCGCNEWSCCSVPVHQCARCGDCDYGENDEAREIRRVCREMNPDLHAPVIQESIEA